MQVLGPNHDLEEFYSNPAVITVSRSTHCFHGYLPVLYMSVVCIPQRLLSCLSVEFATGLILQANLLMFKHA